MDHKEAKEWLWRGLGGHSWDVERANEGIAAIEAQGASAERERIVKAMKDEFSDRDRWAWEFIEQLNTRKGEVCPNCDGSGYFDNHDWSETETECSICKGEGRDE